MSRYAEPVFEVSSVEASARLTLLPTTDPDGIYQARLSGSGVDASVPVAVGKGPFAEYFAQLAQDWRGWPGEKLYTAHAPGIDYGSWVMRLTASADGRGHVLLRVELGEPWLDSPSDGFYTHVGFPAPTDPGSWQASVILKVEAAQLDGLAAAAAQLPHDYRGNW